MGCCCCLLAEVNAAFCANAENFPSPAKAPTPMVGATAAAMPLAVALALELVLLMSLDTDERDIRQVFVEFEDAESFLDELICESCDGFLVTVQLFLLRCLFLPKG